MSRACSEWYLHLLVKIGMLRAAKRHKIQRWIGLARLSFIKVLHVEILVILSVTLRELKLSNSVGIFRCSLACCKSLWLQDATSNWLTIILLLEGECEMCLFNPLLVRFQVVIINCLLASFCVARACVVLLLVL